MAFAVILNNNKISFTKKYFYTLILTLTFVSYDTVKLVNNVNFNNYFIIND